MSPEMMRDPPGIDPRGHAIESRHWGASSCHLVLHEGRYYAWMGAAAGRPVVYPMAGEAAARSFLDDWQATNLLHTPWNETVVHVFLLDPGRAPEIEDTRGRATASGGTGGRARIVYHSAVIDAGGDGIWVASCEDTGDDDEAGDTVRDVLCTSARFDDLGPALDAFAARAEQAADRVERERVSTVPEVVAGVLRYRAAEARAAAARARVGDAVRRAEQQLRAARSISPLASAVGVSREFLYRVLAGDEWTWPGGRRTRPPGSRLPDAPVTTHATYTVGGHQFALVSYTDSEGGKCVAVDQDGQHGASVCDVEVSTKHLVNAGMTMASKTMGQGLAAVYGRAHASVTGLYAVMRSGERVDWPIHHDPRNAERYFAVIADCQELEDIIAVAGRRRTSLKGNFGIWFRAAP
jgi:hypothetical protein